MWIPIMISELYHALFITGASSNIKGFLSSHWLFSLTLCGHDWFRRSPFLYFTTFHSRLNWRCRRNRFGSWRILSFLRWTHIFELHRIQGLWLAFKSYWRKAERREMRDFFQANEKLITWFLCISLGSKFIRCPAFKCKSRKSAMNIMPPSLETNKLKFFPEFKSEL